MTGHHIHTFIRDETGATAIEYAMIASLVILVMFSALAAVGSSVKNTLYTQLAALF